MGSSLVLESEWSLYLEKFEKLMHLISGKISGDPISCARDDNYQDLCASGLESIISWKRKFPDTSFSEIIEDKNFAKYTKTCLWNSKNKKGSLITKKIFLYKNKLSLDFSDSSYM